MIARIRQGATRAEDADAYLDFLHETGFKEYRERFLIERGELVTHYEVVHRAEGAQP